MSSPAFGLGVPWNPIVRWSMGLFAGAIGLVLMSPIILLFAGCAVGDCLLNSKDERSFDNWTTVNDGGTIVHYQSDTPDWRPEIPECDRPLYDRITDGCPKEEK